MKITYCSPSIGALNPFLPGLKLLDAFFVASALWPSDLAIFASPDLSGDLDWDSVLLSALFSNYVDVTSF